MQSGAMFQLFKQATHLISLIDFTIIKVDFYLLCHKLFTIPNGKNHNAIKEQ